MVNRVDFKSVNIFLQVRTSSKRLPNKALLPLVGQSMLYRQVERIKKSLYANNLIILTTTLAEDDIIEKIAESLNVKIFRGELSNVANRFLKCLEAFPCDFFVRITGDCPLICPQIVDDLIVFALKEDVDYCSNNLLPTFPDGLDAEVVKGESFKRLMSFELNKFEKEHVTFGMYTRKEEFICSNYSSKEDLSYMRWTVDTKEDFEFVTSVYEALFENKSFFEYDDILELIRNNEVKNRTHDDYPRNKSVLEYISKNPK